MKLTRRKFLVSSVAVAAVAAVPSIPFATGGIIPKSKYTYVYQAEIPLCEFGNRIPWMSVETAMKGIGEGRTVRTGLNYIDMWVNEYRHLTTHTYKGKTIATEIEYIYKGGTVARLDGHVDVKKVWLDKTESDDYTVIHSDNDYSALTNGGSDDGILFSLQD